MSILDKASLIQIPSGYKSGTLYSIKPNSTDGDFDFSRASSATRVNSEGLIETAQIIGSELITNGDFASDTWWLKSSANVNISNGKGNFTAGTTEYFYKPNILTIGKKYKLVYELTDFTTGYISALGGNWTAVQTQTGTYEIYFTCINDDFGLVGNTFIGSIDNVSVKEVTQNDVPRLDYSGSCPSLLLEGQSTNLVTYSEDFSKWGLKQGTETLNYGISPDGTQNSTRIVFASSNLQFSEFITTGASTTGSIYIKGVSGETINFGLDSSEGLFTLNGNWQRFEKSGTSTSNKITINTFSGATARDIQVWGAQLEEQSYATSYIPTSGATATRTADVCNNAGTAATFNSESGVLFAEIAALASPSSAVFISLSDGGANNKVAFYFDSNNIKGEYVVSGATQSSFTYTPSDITSFNKIAFSYKLNQFKMFANGSQVSVTDTSGNVNPANTFSEIKFDYGNSALKFEGKTKQLITFNEALSNEELADLTGQVNTSFVQLANFYNYTIL